MLNISYPTGFININLLSHINCLKEFLIALKQHKPGRIQVLRELLAQYSCQSHILCESQRGLQFPFQSKQKETRE